MGPDLTIVITCDRCGGDINWSPVHQHRGEMRRVIQGRCTECPRVTALQLSVFILDGRGSKTEKSMATCGYCGAQYERYFNSDGNTRSGKPRKTCGKDTCVKAALSNRTRISTHPRTPTQPEVTIAV